MGLNIKRIFIKIALIIFKGFIALKQSTRIFFNLFKKPFGVIGGILFKTLLPFYKLYLYLRRIFGKIILPSRDILGIATNKYVVHAAIIVLAFATTTQSIYAYGSVLGDYGKKSILFQLSKPEDDEELVEGLPIHSDIDLIDEGAPVSFGGEDALQNQPYSSVGFVGFDYAPSAETASTRTSIEYYIVQKGDTLGKISEEFSITLNTLLWANNLTSRSYIRPGDKLTILPVSGVSHTVKKGETLASVAKKYSAKTEDIEEFNHLDEKASISVGQVLVIPGGSIKYVPPPVSNTGYSSGYASTFSSSGELLWPAPSRRITQYFNWKHPAIDVGMPTGSRLVASEAGKIIYAGWGTGYGLQILIDHGSGFKTRYAHNSRLLVRNGDIVERGQAIALSGNTGWSTGPHLHFEVYVNGVRRNPFLYIK